MSIDPHYSSLFNLSPAEKLQLVEDLWDDLAASPESVPIHDWQKEELARRRENLKQHPDSGVTWDDAKRMIRGQ
jgi:putative addiction module component (TIGR02574 family)